MIKFDASVNSSKNMNEFDVSVNSSKTVIEFLQCIPITSSKPEIQKFKHRAVTKPSFPQFHE